MAKYRDKRISPRGRGTLMEDTLRAAVRLAKDVADDLKGNRPSKRLQISAEAILSTLSQSIRRKMMRRLHAGGAMSLSKLSEPFSITLPSAMKHMEALEKIGLITTHKRGRVRMCVYNPATLQEFARLLLASGI